MRAAPSVHLHRADDGAWRWFQVLLIAFSALSLCYWMLCWWIGPGWTAAMAALVMAALAARLATRFTCPQQPSLFWDGAGWQLPSSDDSQPPAACDVALMFDLGDWLLLRVTPLRVQGRRAVWLAVSRRGAGAAWHGLRVALHMHRRVAGASHSRSRIELPR